MSERPLSTAGFDEAAQGVLYGVEMLATALRAGNSSDAEFARESIARAADEYSGSTDQVARFGFDELSAPESTEREAAAADVLASVLMDVEVANALLVSGTASGDGSAPRKGAELDIVAERLRGVSQALTPAREGAGGHGPRFAFDEVAAGEEVRSSGPGAAATGFERRAAAVLDALVRESKAVIKDAFSGLSGMDPAKALDALGQLGEAVPQLQMANRLVAKGLALAVAALRKLEHLLGRQNAGELRRLLEALLARLRQDSDLLEDFLKRSFGVEATVARVRELAAGTLADTVKIDAGSQCLEELRSRFAEQMAMLKRIVGGLGFAQKVVSLALPQAATVLVFGGLYLLAMGYAVMAGQDFADRSPVLRLVDGVVVVSEVTLG